MRTSRIFLATVIGLPLILSACGTPADEKDKVLEVKEYRTVMKTGKELIDPVHGKETAFWYGAVGGEKSNGVAYIHLFEDGFSSVTVNLNVLVAESGTHYQVFLMSPDGKKEVDIGELQSIIGDARHSLKYETDKDLSGMLNVEVRLMKGLLSKAEVIGRGELKVPAEPVTK